MELTPEQERARYKCIDCGEKNATYSEPVCEQCRAIFAEWEKVTRQFAKDHSVGLYLLYNMLGRMHT